MVGFVPSDFYIHLLPSSPAAFVDIFVSSLVLHSSPYDSSQEEASSQYVTNPLPVSLSLLLSEIFPLQPFVVPLYLFYALSN